MDLLSSDDGSDEPAAGQLAPLPVQPEERPCQVVVHAKSYGRGRHGNTAERKALCARMREAKVRKAHYMLQDRVAADLQAHAQELGLMFTCKGKLKRAATPCHQQWSRKTARTLVSHHALKRHELVQVRGSFLPIDYLQMAFSDNLPGRIHDAAKVFGCSKKWFSKALGAVADAYLADQQALLGRLLVMANVRQPRFVIWRTKFDETTEKIVPDLLDNASSEQQSSAWNVLVVRMTVLYGDVDSDGHSTVLRLELVVPPLLVLTTSSAEALAVSKLPLWRGKRLTLNLG